MSTYIKIYKHQNCFCLKKMIKILFQKIKSYYICKKYKVSVGCGTCEHKHLLMSDKPCLNCVGHYSEWKQTIKK